MRRGMLLDHVLTNTEGLVEDEKAAESLGYSDHEMVEFRILGGRRRAISRIATLDFRTANFVLFQNLLRGIPWVRALAGRGIQDSWLLFKPYFLYAQDWCIPNEQEIKQRRQTSCMDEQGASSKTHQEEEGLWNVERGTGHLELIQERCESMQGCSEEG